MYYFPRTPIPSKSLPSEPGRCLGGAGIFATGRIEPTTQRGKAWVGAVGTTGKTLLGGFRSTHEPPLVYSLAPRQSPNVSPLLRSLATRERIVSLYRNSLCKGAHSGAHTNTALVLLLCILPVRCALVRLCKPGHCTWTTTGQLHEHIVAVRMVSWNVHRSDISWDQKLTKRRMCKREAAACLPSSMTKRETRSSHGN